MKSGSQNATYVGAVVMKNGTLAHTTMAARDGAKVTIHAVRGFCLTTSR